ncbi:MAG: ribosomal RNA small subunit methyltransferase A [Candidatus Bathyarchaeota archaeon]|jgi:16S rRNA (adenine1518-N6/adenine1519-N6)-dimethyltransferase|nr:MAG: ribosomal RNA small subunit methyltransferase A [Candidatus Bathyarchaeota archaeon]
MNLYQKAKEIARVNGIRLKKRMGQHFMIDGHVLEYLVSHAAIKESDTVLEIGAGFGFLTRLLAQKTRRVVAVEIDSRIMKALQCELSDLSNVDFIEADFFNVRLPRFNKVVSNPPFQASSPLIFRLLEEDFDLAVLTLQEDFARRLNAVVGSKDYGRLTVSTYYSYRVELLDSVSREAFYPQPRVDALIVRLKPRDKPPLSITNDQIFKEVVRILFSQRNRKVRKALRPFLRRYGSKQEKMLKESDALPFCEKRVRELTPEDFGVLANALSK